MLYKLLAVALLSGCSTVSSTLNVDLHDWRKVDGLDALVVHLKQYDSPIETGEVCKASGVHPARACAVVRFDEWTCTIHVTKGDDFALTHEQKHCDGYSHSPHTLERKYHEYQRQIRPSN